MTTLLMTRCRILFLTLFLLALQVPVFAQEAAAGSPDMAEGLRSSGKIYVVVLVLATIFAGIIAFLIYLERRLSRLEQDAKDPA
jgi:hypothetical protein